MPNGLIPALDESLRSFLRLSYSILLVSKIFPLGTANKFERTPSEKPPNTHRIKNNTKHSENGEIHLFQGWKLTRARVSFIGFFVRVGRLFKVFAEAGHWNPMDFTCPPKHGHRHRPRKASAMRYPAPNKTHTRIKNTVFHTSFWPHPLEISFTSFG